MDMELREPKAAMTPPRPVGVLFEGNRNVLRSLVTRNAVLFILTLSVYRFWGWTYLRRYFWGNTSLDGEPLEYRGTPWIMLKAFLRMLALLAVVTGLIYGVPVLLLQDITILFVSSLIGALILLAFWSFAAFSRFRFLMHLTRWRGIRPVVKRSASGYVARLLAGIILIALPILGPLTVVPYVFGLPFILFLYFAYMLFGVPYLFCHLYVHLQRYQYEGLMIGNRAVSLDVKAIDFYWIGLRNIALAAVIAIFLAMFAFALTSVFEGGLVNSSHVEEFDISDPEFDLLENVTPGLAFVFVGFATFVYLANIYPLVRAGLQFRAHLLANLTVSGLEWHWQVDLERLKARYKKLIFYAATAAGTLAAVISLFLSSFTVPDMTWLNYSVYGAIVLVLLFKPYFWDWFVWREIFQGLTFHDLSQVDEIVQSVKADGKDLDGFDGGDFDMAAF